MAISKEEIYLGSTDSEKIQNNIKIYEQIKSKFYIINNSNKLTNDLINNYTVLTIVNNYSYKRTNAYKILSNEIKTSIPEIALFIGSGNICLGYIEKNGIIQVYTD